MAYFPFQPGQQPMSSSQGVVIASNQSPVSVAGTVGASIIGIPPVRLSDGTNTANFIANAGGSNSSILQGAQLTAGAYTEVTYSATSVLATTPIDVSNYKWISVQQTLTGGSSTTTFQGSNDNANWASVTMQRIDQTIAAPGTTAAVNGAIYAGPLSFRWFRLNITGIVSGTTSGLIELFTTPTISLSPGGQVALNGTSAVAVGGSVITVWKDSSVLSVPVGSVITVAQSSVAVAIVSGSIAATFTPPANQSVSGTVQVDVRASIGAVIIGGSIATATTNSSVMLLNSTNVIGSVLALQGTNPWVMVGSVYGNVSGSVVSFQGGTHIVSVIGAYPAASSLIASAPGIYALGARNDTLTSILGGDVTFAQMTVGPVGELIVANAPITKWVSGKASCFTGVSQPVIAAQGTSIFTYITSLQIANNSANNVYMSFLDSAGGTVLAYAACPANGGSNIYMPNGLKTLTNGAFHASVSGVASVFVSAEGFISKT